MKKTAPLLAAAASALTACATVPPSNIAAPRSGRLPDFHSPDLAFDARQLRYTCQDSDIGRIPASVEGIVTDREFTIPSTFRVTFRWTFDKSTQDVWASSHQEPVKPRMQVFVSERIVAIGQELLDEVVKKCPPASQDVPAPSAVPSRVVPAGYGMRTAYSPRGVRL